MRNLIIYISAIAALSPYGHAYKHEAAQLRDLLAYPKYGMEFLNDLPLSSSDARIANDRGVNGETEWLKLKLEGSRGRLTDGSGDIPTEVSSQAVKAL